MLKKVISFIWLFFIAFTINSNHLLKIFHHASEFESKVSIYFKNNPIVLLVGQTIEKNNLCKKTYLIKDCCISNNKETQQMLSLFNKFEHPFYKVSIKKTNEGIKLGFLYDCLNIKKIDLFSFDAISLFNGLSFNITHNNVRSFLKKIFRPKGKILFFDRPNVVIDMGHGGSDLGAIGINKKTEKEITLEVGLKLKKILEEMRYNVFLTRDKDEFVALDKRTAMANFLKGKTVFISIHANKSSNASACGLETFYASSTLLNKYNFFNNRIKLESFQDKVKDIKNYDFAQIVHNTLLNKLKLVNKKIVDRKLKKSISQIMLATQMPTALVELGFLSNECECNLLSTQNYQQQIAQGLAQAINKYFAICC